ncbi:MAG: hypothetical protein ACYDAC_04735 [Candidatus Dormibacteria bacterium]
MTTAAPQTSRPRGAAQEAIRAFRRRRLSVGAALIVAVMAAMLPLLVRRVGDADYWWHIVTARWILDHAALPTHDLYTYTVTSHAWTDHEWLTELIMYGLRAAGGQLAVSLGLGAVTWAGFWLILARTQRQRPSALVTAAALGLAAVAGVAVWGPRPQMVTFAFVCLELYLLDRFLHGERRALWVMPPLVLLWANLHGGFVIVFLFLAIALLVEAVRWLVAHDAGASLRTRQLTLATLASVLAGLVNPHGVGLYAYAVRTQFSAVQQSFITEWQSPDFHNIEMRGLEAMLVLLLIGLALRRFRVRPFDLLVAVAGILLALQSVRHIAIFVATATPLLAWSWAPVLESAAARWPRAVARLRLGAPRTALAATAAAALVVVASLVTVRTLLAHQVQSTRDNYPVAAADYLAAHPQLGTHMFSDYAWGGYMIYRFYPEDSRRVFLFGEADLMGDTIMNEYVDIVALHSNWLDILNAHGVDYVVFEPDTALTTALAMQPNWHLVHADAVADVFIRS